MLEDQVANLLQRYLGNYVKGFNKEALKISVWKGNVELTNMQLKPEALNALKLPMKVKAGFLGSVKLKIPWSRLGKEPVVVSLDQIFLLAEPATQVEGNTEDAVQEIRKNRIRETEMKLLETRQPITSEVNKTWLGSLIDTIIGNLKLSITNIHIRYEDCESNLGHPFAAGITLETLSAVTVDDNGKETFITRGALERIQKSVELEQLAVYLDSDSSPWHLDKPWEDLKPTEWSQVLKFGTNSGKPADSLMNHTFLLQPVTGNAKYTKLRKNESTNDGQPLQRVAVNLDDVTFCLSRSGYRNLLKLADNFAAFNQRLKYAHFRPLVPVKTDPRLWWRYANRVVSDELKKASGNLSWEQVLRHARLRKRYISLYASLLKFDLSRAIIDDNKEIEELDRELDFELILQWRMLAHKFVEQSVESELYLRNQKTKKSWWSFGWGVQSNKNDSELGVFSDEDWQQINRHIGYKEDVDEQLSKTETKGDALYTSLEVHMRHNASKLTDDQEFLAELSCKNLDCFVKLYLEAKEFDVKLGSYQLSSPNGLLAKSGTDYDSLVGVFCYKPFNSKLDWSMVAKASPCYITYLKEPIDRIISFFESTTVISRAVAAETAAVVQMTIDEVKRSAQQQVNRALKDYTRFFLDLDIAAPKITIPSNFCPDEVHPTKLLLDLGNLIIRSQDENDFESPDDMNLYLQFFMILTDISAFLVDGEYNWSRESNNKSTKFSNLGGVSFLPVVDKCGIVLKLQQIHLENPSYPSTKLAVRIPSLGFHFSPASYHRLMHVAMIFQQEEFENAEVVHPWSSADLEGWLSLLTWKGVGNREAVWKRIYLCLVGPFLYILENPESRSYKQYLSLRGKHVYQVPVEIVDNVDHVLAVFDSSQPSSKVIEDGNALILRCDSNDAKRTWLSRLQGAIYRASGSAPISGLSDSSSDQEDPAIEKNSNHDNLDMLMEKVFLTGVLDELKICFKYNPSQDQRWTNILLEEERHLFEFRAIGGHIELSTRGNDMFIGTILRSLEIEDLVSCKGMPQTCYLARSNIGNADKTLRYHDAETRGFDSSLNQDDDDRFYEVLEELNENVDSPSGKMLQYANSPSSLLSGKSLLQPPSFHRIDGLLPIGDVQNGNKMEATNTLDSFVKAQIVIVEQNSNLYRNIDKQVSVTLATLTFFCRRPTILAVLKFVDAINIQTEGYESPIENSSAVNDASREDVPHAQHAPVPLKEPAMKGLLGKGKSRIMFYLILNMTRAQILLMNENDIKLATISQDNLVTDIKVFPSSFSIKASLGNLRICDDSLHNDHMYFWVCDMRNPGGSSFVELDFTSFSTGDEDYAGYDYSLLGNLSEIRFVYLNRFVQEVVGYFMGLFPNSSRDVKLRDQVTNSEKWFTTSEIEGSPAVKLDLSLRNPIILMPRRTDSNEYLKLDVVHITIQNTFRWYEGYRDEMNAVHVERLSVMVEDINLNVGTGEELGASIIQDVKGVSVIIHRSLRDLFHKIPNIEVQIKIVELKAALSNKEYGIITECALSNFSETPKMAPSLIQDFVTPVGTEDPPFPQGSEATNSENQNSTSWVTMKVGVDVDLIELCLHYGVTSDASLAIVQVTGCWILYKTNTIGDGFLSASIKGFTVIDDREGTEQALRLAIRKPETIGYSPTDYETDNEDHPVNEVDIGEFEGTKPVSTMVILDAKLSQYSTFIYLCVQRPQLLVALDFLLAVVEFFVPTVRDLLSNEGENTVDLVDAIILEHSIYSQPSVEFYLSPRRPLFADDERFDHFVYDGRGGTLYIQNGGGSILSSPSNEAVIYIGNGKRLQFKNVTIKNGAYLDSCIFLGTNSNYSALENDNVYLESVHEFPQLYSSEEASGNVSHQNPSTGRSTEFVIELQAIGPELTFYDTSKDVGRSVSLSNKLLHTKLDVFSKVVMKGEMIEMNTNILGLRLESNGIIILEPFDASVKFSNISGKMNIHFSVSDIFMNFSFSILKLFLAVEDDILAFLRTTSRKMTITCFEFDKVGTIENTNTDQVFTFWRPRTPPGFTVLGDYLTPFNKPPAKEVLAVSTSLVRVKRPVSFKQVWPPIHDSYGADPQFDTRNNCSVWFPVAPKGFVALGCVVSTGVEQPPLSSSFCVLASLVAPCALGDCIAIKANNSCPLITTFWRVNNSLGTFLPGDPSTLGLTCRAYELRHMYFGSPSPKESKISEHEKKSGHISAVQSEAPSNLNVHRFEVVASFRLIWWNQSSNSRKKVSIWRPMVPPGMVYFGDIAVQGYEPPNSCVVLLDTEGDEHLKTPIDFQLAGQIKKKGHMDSISFWLPQAPPGFVSLGCIACKGTPKQSDLSLLRCVRSDMVTGDKFHEESIWDASEIKSRGESFSIWTIDNEFGTFIARSGFKKPPKRFALRLTDPDMSTGSEDTVIDGEIGTFSVALFDDYGGLMVPLFNVSLSNIGFNLHGRTGCLTSFINFSLAARSYNDKYEVWEPLIEPVDGFLRYMYNQNTPGAPSQIRLTCSKDLNVNVSVSNCNMVFQAYASWNNLAQVHDSFKEREASSSTYVGKSFLDMHNKRNYFITHNKLGQDIFIRATEMRGISSVIKMPSGVMKLVKVPVWKNMLDSHLKGSLHNKFRTLVAIIVSEAEFPRVGDFSSRLYNVAVRVRPEQGIAGVLLRNPQSARTCGILSENHSSNSDHELVKWNEMLFFRVDTLEGYMVELVVTDTEKGGPIGYFSASLKHVAETFMGELTWLDLSSFESVHNGQIQDSQKLYARIRCAFLLSPEHEVEIRENSAHGDNKSRHIQVSPSKEGPWTTVRVNYAAPAACWRLGNNVVSSEVSVKDGNRYVSIRTLVSVRNNTDFKLNLCLEHRASNDGSRELDNTIHSQETLITGRFETDIFFETEEYDPSIGWVGCKIQPNIDHPIVAGFHQGISRIELPSGWDWVDDWHLDKTATGTDDGWVYAPDIDSLKWPMSFSSKDSKNFARRRKWIRNRKHTLSGARHNIFLGPLEPGESLSLPLSSLSQTELYILQLRPSNLDPIEHSWSSVVDCPKQSEVTENRENSEICVSNLVETEALLYCSPIGETSSNSSRGIWFCLSIQATEIAKDIHSDPIQDWALVVKSPLSITNYLPLSAEYSVLEMQSSGHFVACTRGVFFSGKSVNIHTADIRKPLYLSLLPQRGWLPIHDAVLLSHPTSQPSKSINLKSSISGRVVQIVLEQNDSKEKPSLAKIIRIYSPYWITVAQCPPLTIRLLELEITRETHKTSFSFKPKKKNEDLVEEITDAEMCDGCSIASALNLKSLGVSMSINQSSDESFGPIKDLSPLADMDGSLDICAYNNDGNCMHLFISSKPCLYQSIPTKVISVRPFITFTNRIGCNILLKLSSEDEPKVLHAYDSRVSFIHHPLDGPNTLQVRLENTAWSFPTKIFKEDTIFLMLRNAEGGRTFLRTEIRGYEEGSRFIVVFRLGPENGPIRLENKTVNNLISIRQSGFDDDAWVELQPLSTINFTWEDPYGPRLIDAKVESGFTSIICSLDLDKTGISQMEGVSAMLFMVIEIADIKIGRFTDAILSDSTSNEIKRISSMFGNLGNSHIQHKYLDAAPLEFIVELGMVGVSLIDYKPKELLYFYLERVCMSYSTGYDGGMVSRFKLILGQLQVDNQLPLTLMPVLLATEQVTDMNHPVFKMTLTTHNERADGIQVYPYLYIRVTDKSWRLNIHEPIIWALVDFYNSLQLDRIPQSSNGTQVDPEIRIDLIDVSEVRVKVSLETAPALRPSGILGIWSPILSAVGNAFKIQVHLRKVIRRDRFMRKSSVLPAIGNRIWRDLIHNPLHLIFSVDVLGMTSSTLASLSKGFAELSTDGQFLQLRSKQVWSRKIVGVSDGIKQGTEALAQGVAFGVTGVVTKPVESARESGLVGFAHGLGRAFLGIIVQPVSGALDFFSLTVDGIGASCSRCLEILSNKTTFQRVRNPRAIRSDNIIREYIEKEAIGQMVLYLAEGSRHFGCTDIFKEPSKFAWSDYYEDHFSVPNQRVVLVTNRRVMLLQCLVPDKMDKEPCKILWDVPWEELLSIELAKAGCSYPSHLILHIKNFRRSEVFARVIKCITEDGSEQAEPQAIRICSVARKMWKIHKFNKKNLTLKVPSSQRNVYFAWSDAEGRNLLHSIKKPMLMLESREFSSSTRLSPERRRFVKHSINFSKVWSSELESKSRCTLCRKKEQEGSRLFSIWRPTCPNGYVSVGDIAHIGNHPPNAAAVYLMTDNLFAPPLGYDLVWRNCEDDYTNNVSIWYPRAPHGFISLGCVAVGGYEEPEGDLVRCISERAVEETSFEEQKIWSAPDSYPWECHIYQVKSDALHFVVLRQLKECSEWKPMRVLDRLHIQAAQPLETSS